MRCFGPCWSSLCCLLCSAASHPQRCHPRCLLGLRPGICPCPRLPCRATKADVRRTAQARTSPCPTSEPQLRPAVLLKPAQSCRARIGFDATIGGSYGLVSYDWVRMAALLGLFLGQRCHLGRPSDCLDLTRCYCAEQREATVGEHKAHGRREAYGHTSCGNKSGKSRCARVGL